jgi:ABC-type Fe3+/spermidine/putrescine transport system ATPase subunit
MADEIAVMAEGRIVQTGTPTALYQRPASRFVAHFLGESNLETGRIDAALGPGTWRVDAAGLPVVGTGTGAWRPGDTVTVAVRPERVRLTPAGPDRPLDSVNSYGGRIAERVFRGALQRYRDRLPHGQVWSVDEPAAGGQPRYAVGDEVGVSWRPDDCLVIPES